MIPDRARDCRALSKTARNVEHAILEGHCIRDGGRGCSDGTEEAKRARERTISECDTSAQNWRRQSKW